MAPPNPPTKQPELWRVLALWVAFAAIALAIYRPALAGPPIFDDALYLASPFVQALDREHLEAIFDPAGQSKYFTGNYAPIPLLAHAVEIRLFGAELMPYHVVNVLLHATNAALLVALLASTGVPGLVAALGGGLFLVHPANVEAVAWISQLKSLLALALCLLALLALRRQPGLASVLFVLALLTKVHAVFALPMAAVLLLVRWGEEGCGRRQALWLAGWAFAFALIAPVQVDAFAQTAAAHTDPADATQALRSALANAGRYLVMAATGYGVSAFHEPPPTRSWLDPWLLVGLALGALLAARALSALRARKPEAAFWVGALAAWVPVSQLYSFVSPVGDRYLYFMLPGLIGGVTHACAGPGRIPGLAARTLQAAGALWVAVCLVVFSLHAHRRAPLWTDTNRVLADSASQYPDGSVAAYLAARRAAVAGDAAGAVAALRRSAEIELSRTQMAFLDPYFARLKADPAFQAFAREVAQRYLELGRAHQLDNQAWLQTAAGFYVQIGDWDAAEDAMERAIRLGGPLRPQLLGELDELHAARRAARGAAPAGPDPGTAPGS